MGDAICVVLTADVGFIKQLAVTVESIVRSSRGNRAHRIFLVHDRLGADDREMLDVLATSNVSLEWIDGHTEDFASLRLPHQLTAASLFRLRMEELLPLDVERVVYLDCDVIVRRPLDEIWEHELGADHLVGAVRDASLPWAATAMPWRELSIHPGSPYFNSGVLLVPLAAWRTEQVGERTRELVSSHQFEYPDQTALNVVLHERWLQLNPTWNLQSLHLAHGDASLGWVVEPEDEFADALADPAVVHLCKGGFNRPWEPGSRHPYRDEWFASLDGTPWNGWRPSNPSTLDGGVRRAKRALRALRGRS